MNFNKKVIALIAAGLILIAAIIYFVFIRDYSQSPAPQGSGSTPETAQPAPAITDNQAPPEIVPPTPAELTREDVQRLSLSFAERFGSSSNQSDFNNLSDLEVFMTDAMIERTRAYVAAQKAKGADMAAYSGVTTKAVIVDFKTFDEAGGTAEATVRTKRQEKSADGSLKNFDQSLALVLKKVGGEWKIDSAEWVK